MSGCQCKEKPTVCVLTTTRADYGILRPLLFALSNSDVIDLRIVVTGAHLSDKFGMTVREIIADNLPIHSCIPVLEEENGSAKSMSAIMARTLERFGEYFELNRPDLLVVLGDRYETFAVCAAAVAACIPIAHLHGGEITEGLMDECFRHSITKMSLLHFTSTEQYRRRVIQLGESPESVFNFGALGVENALHMKLLSPEQLEESIGYPLFKRPLVVVTFHPVTLERNSEEDQIRELLSALEQRTDLNFLITKANADIGGQLINDILDQFAREHDHCYVVTSLGMLRYMSVLKYAKFVLGNSSSGLIEVPSFGIPTINIGNRQQGRIQAESVINCAPDCADILRALKLADSEEFREKAALVKNPYGDGNTSQKIAKTIEKILCSGGVDIKKSFYDLAFEV